MPRFGGARPRTKPDAVLAGRSYPTSVTKECLRSREIRTVNPESRIRSGPGRTRARLVGARRGFDAQAYKGRNLVERAFNTVKQWRGLATR